MNNRVRFSILFGIIVSIFSFGQSYSISALPLEITRYYDGINILAERTNGEKRTILWRILQKQEDAGHCQELEIELSDEERELLSIMQYIQEHELDLQPSLPVDLFAENRWRLPMRRFYIDKTIVKDDSIVLFVKKLGSDGSRSTLQWEERYSQLRFCGIELHEWIHLDDRGWFKLPLCYVLVE
jgi:hypothetical protein